MTSSAWLIQTSFGIVRVTNKTTLYRHWLQRGGDVTRKHLRDFDKCKPHGYTSYVRAARVWEDVYRVYFNKGDIAVLAHEITHVVLSMKEVRLDHEACAYTMQMIIAKIIDDGGR